MGQGLGDHQREILRVLGELRQDVNRNGRACYLVPYLAERTGRSQRTTRRAVEALRRRGLVEVSPSRQFLDGRGNGACLTVRSGNFGSSIRPSTVDDDHDSRRVPGTRRPRAYVPVLPCFRDQLRGRDLRKRTRYVLRTGSTRRGSGGRNQDLHPSDQVQESRDDRTEIGDQQLTSVTSTV